MKRERRLTDDGIEQERVLRKPLWDVLDDVIEHELDVTHATRKSYRAWAARLAKSGYLGEERDAPRPARSGLGDDAPGVDGRGRVVEPGAGDGEPGR